MPELRVGTRGSLLALTQTRAFVAALEQAHPGVKFHEVLIQTEGDKTSIPLNQATQPGLFVSALRDALLAGEVDFIVHSMKDLPAVAHPEILTACVPVREDNRDGLVARDGLTLDTLPAGSVVGTSSPRRTASLRSARPDLDIRPIRGNVDTRIAKVRRGEFDATLLAMAGLNRIGRSHEVSQIFAVDHFVPAAAQGALSVECRASDMALVKLLSHLEDPATRLTSTAERAVLRGLSAGCATAIGASATFIDGTLSLTAELAVEDTGASARVTETCETQLSDVESAELLGRRVANALLAHPIATDVAWA